VILEVLDTALMEACYWNICYIDSPLLLLLGQDHHDEVTRQIVPTNNKDD
jgi:hypothetical protein